MVLNQLLEEYNKEGVVLYSLTYPGASAQGASRAEALGALEREMELYLWWAGLEKPGFFRHSILESCQSPGRLCDGQATALFEAEKTPLTEEAYQQMKALCLKSAQDVASCYAPLTGLELPPITGHQCIFSVMPASCDSMVESIHEANKEAFRAYGLTHNLLAQEAALLACRERAFEAIEQEDAYLDNRQRTAEDGEAWTLRKVFRRLIWNDRIRVRPLVRRARHVWPVIPSPFGF